MNRTELDAGSELTFSADTSQKRGRGRGTKKTEERIEKDSGADRDDRLVGRLADRLPRCHHSARAARLGTDRQRLQLRQHPN